MSRSRSTRGWPTPPPPCATAPKSRSSRPSPGAEPVDEAGSAGRTTAFAIQTRVQHEDFDVGAEIARLRAGRDEVGAIASFVGTVRASSGGVALECMRLDY